jgi:hypothetical protein
MQGPIFRSCRTTIPWDRAARPFVIYLIRARRGAHDQQQLVVVMMMMMMMFVTCPTPFSPGCHRAESSNDRPLPGG